MVRVGIIGFGLSSRYLQAPFFLRHPGFDLRLIYTSQHIPEAEFPAVKKANSVDEIIHSKNIDLVSICSPNATHFEFAQAALDAGKHVLVEKPLTPTADEASLLFNFAESRNLTLAVYHNRRFDSDFLTLQSVLNSGELGNISYFEAQWNRFKPDLNSKAWKEENSAASGILYDLGSHLIDQSIALFGLPAECEGKVFTERKDSKIDDAFELELIYPDMIVKLSSSLMKPEPAPRYILKGNQADFLKYGIDPQEDHLKSGIMPGDANYGEEEAEIYGKLFRHEDKSATIVRSLKGDWMKFFDNLHQLILDNASSVDQKNAVLKQLEIIEAIKK